MKRHNAFEKYLGAFGALLALAAAFLPFSPYTSLFASLGPVWGPVAVCLLALAAVLCALGRPLPAVPLAVLLDLPVLLLLGCGISMGGLPAVLARLRPGAWLLLLGLAALTAGAVLASDEDSQTRRDEIFPGGPAPST